MRKNTYKEAVEQAVMFLEKNLRNICSDPFDYVMVNSIYENKEDFIQAFKESMRNDTRRISRHNQRRL